MIDDLAIASQKGELMARAGKSANKAAAAVLFINYRSRKAGNTIKRQDADLALFAQFLAGVGVPVGDLAQDLEAWRGVTWGIVEAFVTWQLQNGYAVGTINGRLSTVKVYADMATKSGMIESSEMAMIRTVKGYKRVEQKNVDEKRTAAGIETRRTTNRAGQNSSGKKAAAVILSLDQARQLKDQPDTPQGRRDRLALCIMLDLGLRVGELAALTVDNFDLPNKRLTFYRQKVDKTQTMALKNGLLAAAQAWFKNDAPAIGSVWRSSRKSKIGKLQDSGWSIRAINARVTDLGAAAGIENLSPHDLRHYWATQAARSNTPIDKLITAGGWSSPMMPLRYIEAEKIANEGVIVEE